MDKTKSLEILNKCLKEIEGMPQEEFDQRTIKHSDNCFTYSNNDKDEDGSFIFTWIARQ